MCLIIIFSFKCVFPICWLLLCLKLLNIKIFLLLFLGIFFFKIAIYIGYKVILREVTFGEEDSLLFIHLYKS